MGETIAIHLRDLGKPLVDAWQRELAGTASVRTSCGDIFSTKSGQIAPRDPIDVKADAIVSPANSFGFMDGGIDAVYTYQFGDGLQRRLRAVIERDFGGERPFASPAMTSSSCFVEGRRATSCRPCACTSSAWCAPRTVSRR